MLSLEVYDISMFGYIHGSTRYQHAFISFQQWVIMSAIEQCCSDQELPRSDNILNGMDYCLGDTLDNFDPDELHLIEKQANQIYNNVLDQFRGRQIVNHLQTPDNQRGVIIIFKD